MIQQQSKPLWEVNTNQIDPNRYFGVMVANGMIGLVSDAQPMHVKEVVLNGVYDRYQRGRVSNLLKGFNPLNIDLMVNNQHLGLSNIQEYEQSLDMKQAKLVSSFVTDNVKVQHEMLALRNLPYTLMLNLELTALEDLEFTLFNHMESPDHLRDVRNFYSEIDRPHVVIKPLLLCCWCAVRCNNL